MGDTDQGPPPDFPTFGGREVRPYPFLEPSRGGGELGWLLGYRILCQLGSGGMGIVFEAEDTSLRRLVALKIMRPELAADPDNRLRFLREARAAAAITSDHVVTIYQVGEDAGTPYLAMHLMIGQTLHERLVRARGPLPTREALTIARHTAAGLRDAHGRGLTHRDIKPANLWLQSDRPGRPFHRVRLLDFGLAISDAADPRLTAQGIVVGTPQYMAPEQARGEATDHRSDLFSLGCVLFHMLTGQPPFPGRTATAVIMALGTYTPVPVNNINPAAPAVAADLVAKLLEKDPGARVQSATAVIEAIDAILVTMSDPAPPTASDPHRTPVVPPLPRSNKLTRRALVIGTPLAGAGLLGLGLALRGRDEAQVVPPPMPVADGEPIRVGVLHSLSGTMAVSESPVVDATLLAVAEVNDAGGVLGRPVRPLVLDGKSDPDTFALLAEKLLVEEQVPVVFGCWTSASRKAVRPVVQRHNGLLFYPVQYEGLEQSPRIVYLGPAPNQQLIPAVDFLAKTLGKKRLYIVGSDYVFPRTADAIVRDRVAELQGVEVAGASYLALGASDVAGAVAAIKAANPDAILNTVNGSTNFHLFKALRRAGVKSGEVPTLSVSITENELRGIDPAVVAGDYLAASYFQAVRTGPSQAFVEKIRRRYGQDRVVSDMMAAAYSGVHLWADAARRAKTVKPTEVLAAVRGASFAGPGGTLTVDAVNQHAWLPVRLAQVRPGGQLKLLAGSDEPVRPEPFPSTRSRETWERFLNELFIGWDGRWQSPGDPRG